MDAFGVSELITFPMEKDGVEPVSPFTNPKFNTGFVLLPVKETEGLVVDETFPMLKLGVIPSSPATNPKFNCGLV